MTDETIQQMVILDRSVAFVPTVPNTDGVGALIIRQAGVVATLVDLFEWAWGQAGDLNTAGPPVLSPQQLQILRLMTTMVKDEVAARELGIGVRTYRRHVAALLTKLQAANRVQAAVIAKQHGWV
ncbi:LuxR C-terminal-related transcriptional regulator [Nonomuraea sp. NPDC059023]|uniref:helix-turn-helix transcriptional regulator n=1 Tax=unclassified Nonomuraea TaxID=2593643 RepID=UPI0036A69F15